MSRSARKRRSRSRSKPRSKLLLGTGVIVAFLAIAGLGAVGYVLSIAASAPPIDSLKARDPGGFSLVYAKDGKRLGVIQADELRKAIPNSQIPQNIKDATVAIEDSRFYKHSGVDYQGIVRAAVRNAEAGKDVEGASTITQQLIRNLYIGNEKTYTRKIREAKLAEELEDKHSKPWILNTYLNNVPYGTYGGQAAIGVWAASKTYFNKAPSELSLSQSALLAGLPQAPSEYSPVRSPSAAKNRRDDVLRAMAKQGYITRAEAIDAIDSKLDIDMSTYFQKRREGFFFDYVQDKLYESFPRREVKRGGLRVYTTVDLDKQQEARAAIQGKLAGIGPSSAIVSVNPANGNIETMASSADYGKSKFNLAAQGHRQPGSSFKVMALMAALDRGVDPNSTTYVSKPLDFNDPQYGPIKVKTYSSTYGGTENLVRATLSSDNSVYTQLALDLGPDKVAETAKKLGITSKLNGYPAETLGGLENGVSPLEMATAYATIASGGVYHRPRAIIKIKEADGTVLSGKKLPPKLRPRGERRFSDGVTAEATKILEANVKGGTGTSANIGCPAAGKTGTTDEHSDGWFVGYTPKLSTAVWVGYPNASVHMYTEYHGGPVAGGTFPAEIWHDYMMQAKGGYCGSFSAPKEAFKAQPFFGRYAGGKQSTGPSGDTSVDPSATPVPGADAPTDATPGTTTGTDPATGTDTGAGTGGGGTDTGGGTGADTGGQGYDPALYESAPQDGN